MKESPGHTEHQDNEATQESESLASQTTPSHFLSSDPSTSQNEETENDQKNDNSLFVSKNPEESSKSGNTNDNNGYGTEHNQNPDVSIFEQALGNMQDDINFRESTDSENDSQPPPPPTYTDAQLAFLHSLGISVCMNHFYNVLGRFRGLLEH